MKNTIICSIAVLSAALLAACTETTRIWPEEGESKAYVEVSSQKVIFDADGGNAVITTLLILLFVVLMALAFLRR